MLKLFSVSTEQHLMGSLVANEKKDVSSPQANKRNNKNCSTCGKCQYIISHRNQSFNLLNSRQRELAIKYLLENVYCNSNSEYILISSCTKLSAYPHLQANLMQFEFIRDHKKLSRTLNAIETVMSTHKKCDYHYGMRNILDIMIYNPLIIKYMFQSSHTDQIWKSLMVCIVMILSFNDPLYLPLLSSEIIATPINDEWRELYHDFVSTIDYWKYHHISYFIEKRLSVLMRNTFAKSQDFWRRGYNYRAAHDLSSTSPMFMLYSSWNLYSKIVKRILKVGDEKLYNLFERETKQDVDSDYVYIAMQFSQQFGNNDIYKARVVHCGYPFCNKTKSEFIKRNECKRCKLIRYCSRNHQKKHWKMIHSQQCKKY